MALSFAASFLTVGLFLPFYPVWLEAEGLGAREIGIILAAQIALRLFISPFVLQRADRAGDRARVLIVLAFAAAASVVPLFFADGFVPLLLGTLLVAAIWSSIVPLTDAIALSGVRRLAIDYGRTRLWGSVAFIVANVVGGLVVTRAGVEWYLPLLMASFSIAALLTLKVPRVGRPQRTSPPPLSVASEPWTPVRLLWRRALPGPDLGVLVPALLAIALVQASHGFFYGFGSIQWKAFGYSATEIGVFWAIGVVAEVALFRYATSLSGWFDARRFLLLGGVFAVVRWALFPFDLGLFGFALAQMLHALTFGATHLALQVLIARTVAESRLGAAQGIAFAAQTGMMAVATACSGFLYAQFGAFAFLAAAAMALAGTVTGLLATRAWGDQPQSAASGGDTMDEE